MKKTADGQFVGRINHPIFGKCTLRRDGVVQTSQNKPRTSTTLSQYARNARLRNAAALWNKLKPLGIEEFFSGLSAYNTIAADASKSPCSFGMVKAQKDKGYCTIAPILVSCGDILPVVYDETLGCTNISIGNHTLDKTTLFGDFCRWIVENNPAFEYGDKLSIVFVEQDYINEKPLVLALLPGIILEKDYQFSDTLAEFYPEFFNLLSTVDVDIDEKALTINPEEKMCAFAFVHSGYRDNGLTSSTQHLICRFDPWDLQLPLLKKEFKSVGGVIRNPPILTRENGVLCQQFGYPFNPIQTENQF